MIIFDDILFREWVKENGFRKMKSRNHAFQSIARTSESEEECYQFFKKYMSEVNRDIFTDDELRDRVWFYYNLFESRSPVTPHSVFFDSSEVEMIKGLKSILSKRVNFSLLFLFKYFNTKNIKLPIKELLLMTGYDHHKYRFSDIEFIPIIKAKVGNVQMKDKKRIFPEVFYYKPLKENNKDVVIDYNGDIFCVAGVEFNSNLQREFKRIVI